MNARVIPVLILFACAPGPEEPPVCEPDPTYDYSAGRLWGPCLDGECEIGSCLITGGVFDPEMPDEYDVTHDICVTRDGCAESVMSPWCGEVEPEDSLPDAACVPSCLSDADCLEGMSCVHSICSWPNEGP